MVDVFMPFKYTSGARALGWLVDGPEFIEKFRRGLGKI